MKFKKDSLNIPKTEVSLVDPEYILATARVLTEGAKKYGKDNWKNCPYTDLYKDALLRHILAYMSGELVDPETGENHLYHASCNLMFLAWFDNNLINNDYARILSTD